MTRATAHLLAFQGTFALLTLTFGCLALRVASRPGRNVRLGAWYVTGVTVTTSGGMATILNVLAVAAVLQGNKSPLFKFTSGIQTIGNDARGFAVFGLALTLIYMMRRRRPAPAPRAVAAGLAALLAVGALLGVLEGEFNPGKQYGVMSLIGGASVIAFFAALYAGLVSDAMDWHLWTALAVYAVREALNTIVEASRAVGFLANVWMPSQAMIMYLGAASVVVMIWCALVRLGWARGAEPPALMERLGG